MKSIAVFLGLVLAGSACAHGESMETTRAHVRFTVKDAQVEPAVYSLEIYEDGSGNYTASYPASAQDAAGEQVDETIHIHGRWRSCFGRRARIISSPWRARTAGAGWRIPGRRRWRIRGRMAREAARLIIQAISG